MATMSKYYETYQFFQMTEDKAPNVDNFIVMVEDMGEDCMCI